MDAQRASLSETHGREDEQHRSGNRAMLRIASRARTNGQLFGSPRLETNILEGQPERMEVTRAVIALRRRLRNTKITVGDERRAGNRTVTASHRNPLAT
jgi:hypothetical protein